MLFNFLEMVVFALLAMVFMYIGKVIVDWIVNHRYNTDLEIEKEDNLAIALRRSGFYLGIAIAMTASIVAIEDFWTSIIHQSISGILILVFLFIAMWFSDKSLLYGVNVTKELKNKNISIGIVEFALYISTGLIAYASFVGEDGPFIASIVFFALGQIVLLSIIKLYGYMESGIYEKIKSGNIASGIIVAGIMIAYSIILQTAILGEFVSWKQDLLSFAFSAIIGVFMLLIFANKLIDKFFLPTSTISQELEEDNYAAMILMAFLKVAIALIIARVVF